MRCNRPINTKNGLVPCGRCLVCLQERQKQFAFRITKESENYSHKTFVTLTYDDDHLPRDGILYRPHIFKFLRKLKYRLPSKPAYAICGEYGGQLGRPHWHAIIMCNLPAFDKIENYIRDSWTDDKGVLMCDEGVGLHFQKVCDANIMYVCKYALKLNDKNQKHDRFIVSQKMGRSYVPNERDLTDLSVFNGNSRISLPRYYRDKLATDQKINGKLAQSDKLAEIEMTQMREWINKNPNKPFSDFLKWKDSQYIGKCKLIYSKK